MKQFIEKIRNKENLTFNESKAAFELLMDGKADDHEIFDFLTLLSAKGEASDEIAGGVYVLRNKSKRVSVENCIDTCGTGGDGMNTLNISTASALLLSSMGIKVAKHGNKAVSSRCGSGDVGEALNIKINLEMTYSMWKNSFYCDVIGSKGSAHIESLCKWSKSKLIFRKRILPSGEPIEKINVYNKGDPTWAKENVDFEKSVKIKKKPDLKKDIIINNCFNKILKK